MNLPLLDRGPTAILLSSPKRFFYWAISLICIAGEPSIDCGQQEITFRVRSRKPFQGRLFVKDQLDNRECTTGFGAPNSARTALRLNIRMGTCNMRRQRTVCFTRSAEVASWLKFSFRRNSAVDHARYAYLITKETIT